MRRKSGFAPGVTGKITIYSRYVNPKTGEHINIRCILGGCFWNEDSAAIFQKTGQRVSRSISLYIPLNKEITGREFIYPDKWASMSFGRLGGYWTFDMRRLPLITRGEYPFAFQWGSTAQVVSTENQLIASDPNIIRATDFNAQLFGSEGMRHFVIRA